MVDRKDDDMLEAFFEAGRADVPSPSSDLMARILADADAQLPVAEVAATRTRGWRGALELLGGWGAVAGLGAATFAGLGLGLYMPDTLNTMTQDILGGQATSYSPMDMTASFYDLAEEG